MRENVASFILGTLAVDAEDFSMETVSAVRRVRSFGGSGIKDECLVIFSSVEVRDFVYSHARNLAGQDTSGGNRTSNLRLHVPAHLLECFRTLDKHGHILKMKHEKKGHKIKRHINFDDDTKSLYLDVKVSRDHPWEHVYPDVAREERKAREKKYNKSRRTRTTSTISSSDSEDGSDKDEDWYSEEPGPSRQRNGSK